MLLVWNDISTSEFVGRQASARPGAAVLQELLQSGEQLGMEVPGGGGRQAFHLQEQTGAGAHLLHLAAAHPQRRGDRSRRIQGRALPAALLPLLLRQRDPSRPVALRRPRDLLPRLPLPLQRPLPPPRLLRLLRPPSRRQGLLLFRSPRTGAPAVGSRSVQPTRCILFPSFLFFCHFCIFIIIKKPPLSPKPFSASPFFFFSLPPSSCKCVFHFSSSLFHFFFNHCPFLRPLLSLQSPCS